MRNLFITKRNKVHQNQSGFSVVEVLVACMIMSTIVLALMSAASKGIELSSQALKQMQATSLIEEGAEVVKLIRDDNWSTLTGYDFDTNYYPTFNLNTNTWSLGTTPVAPIDGVFTRVIVFSEVSRDSNDDIVLSEGTPDSGTIKVNVIVSWPSSSGTISRNVTFYLADIFN